jgi:hypothetical protein
MADLYIWRLVSASPLLGLLVLASWFCLTVCLSALAVYLFVGLVQALACGKKARMPCRDAFSGGMGSDLSTALAG